MYNDSCFQHHCAWQNLQASYSFIAKLTHHSQLLIFWFWFLSKKFSAWSNRGMWLVQLDWSDWAFGVAIREWQAFNGWSIIRVCFCFLFVCFYNFIYHLAWGSVCQVINFLSGNCSFDFSFFFYILYTLIYARIVIIDIILFTQSISSPFWSILR